MPIVYFSEELLTRFLSRPNPKSLILDVRERAEYNEEHLKNSKNLPLSSLKQDYTTLSRHASYLLLCQSGSRAKQAATFLESVGFNNLIVAQIGIEDLKERYNNLLTTAPMKNLWSIDRQFRFALGLLIALGLLGTFFISDSFLVIPSIICLGLMFTALIDRCYFRLLIAALPWNKKQT